MSGSTAADALIVAVAIEADCSRLYSEDLQHGRRLGDCVVVNSFLGGNSYWTLF
jgi:predicted nucleic acid-binding protein